MSSPMSLVTIFFFDYVLIDCLPVDYVFTYVLSDYFLSDYILSDFFLIG